VKIAAKKRKRTLTEAVVAQAVVDAAEEAERGGRSSGIRIGKSCFHLEGR
jgi:phage FluMu gp28-like protein